MKNAIAKGATRPGRFHEKFLKEFTSAPEKIRLFPCFSGMIAAV
jgi:hypothetical protein